MTSLLLDTEALIWWSPTIRGSVARSRGDPERAGGFRECGVAWEIVIKTTLGKLQTTRLPSAAVAEGGFRELAITFEHAEAVRALPLHHTDPFDRLIIATAGVEGCVVVTSEEKFRLYDVPLVDARA